MNPFDNTAAESDVGGRTILIIDDDPNNLALLSDHLEEAGLKTLVAEDGESGLKRAEYAQPDLIILDVLMPGMDGFEACRRLKGLERTKDIPVIFMTALTEMVHKVRGFAAGGVDYITKPFQRDEVLARVFTHLRIRELTGRLREANENLEKRVSERTAELARANRDLQEEIIERQQAEEALLQSRIFLDKIINSISDPIFVKDRKHRWVLLNDAFCTFMGLGRQELIGKSDYAIFPENEADVFWSKDEEVFVKGLENVNEEKITDGRMTTHTIVTTKNLYEDEKGEKYIVGIIRDVCEQRRLEEQLRQSVKMEAIGTLAGGVAHDFNNLLTVILGYSDIALQRVGQDDPVVKNIEQIRKAGQRAALLTNQLLSFSRKQVVQPKVIHLNEVIADMEKMLKRLIGENIDLVSMLDPRLARVMADPGLIGQVIMNIAINARDAMPHGGKLTIETANVFLGEDYARHHFEAEPGHYVMLAFSDTGCGMSEATLSHVFEPFFTTKSKGKGTGLGLSVVFGIVKQSGGHIWVYSEPGSGTTFKIYLPSFEQDSEWLDRGAESQEPPTGGGETVLLVEDDDLVRDLAGISLRNYGYTVLEARDGYEALKTCSSHESLIHILVTDVVMPGMNGRQLAEGVKSLCPAMKILYISGYTDNAIVHHGVLDAGTAFLQKPLTPDSLARKVREVLDTPGSGK